MTVKIHGEPHIKLGNMGKRLFILPKWIIAQLNKIFLNIKFMTRLSWPLRYRDEKVEPHFCLEIRADSEETFSNHVDLNHLPQTTFPLSVYWHNNTYLMVIVWIKLNCVYRVLDRGLLKISNNACTPASIIQDQCWFGQNEELLLVWLKHLMF